MVAVYLLMYIIWTLVLQCTVKLFECIRYSLLCYRAWEQNARLSKMENMPHGKPNTA